MSRAGLARLLSVAALSLVLIIVRPDSVAADRGCQIAKVELVIVVGEALTLEATETIERSCPDRSDQTKLIRPFPDSKDQFGRVEVLTVTDGSEHKLAYQTESDGSTLLLKVEPSDQKTAEDQTVRIRYRVTDSIRVVDNRFRLNWPLLTVASDGPIGFFRADLIFPEGVTEFNTTIRVSDGLAAGATNPLTNFQWFDGGENRRKLTIKSNAAVPPNNEIVLEASSTATEFIVAGETDERTNPLLWLIIPIFGSIFSLLAWLRYGRDPRADSIRSVRSQPPKDLSPLEIGFVDGYGSLKTSYLVAAIVDLATRGYLQIEQKEVEQIFHKKHIWQFVLRRTDLNSLKSYERLIIKQLFGEQPQINSAIELEQLRYNFYPALPQIQTAVEQELRPRQLLESKGRYLHLVFIALSVVLFLSGLTAIVFPTESDSWRWLGASLGLTGLSFAVVGIFMPKRTDVGAQIEDQIKAFRLYLEKVDQHRSKDAPDDRIFERYLPYAIGFGLTESWLRQMNRAYELRQQPMTVWRWLVVLPSSLTSFVSFVAALDQLIELTEKVIEAESPSADPLENER